MAAICARIVSSIRRTSGCSTIAAGLPVAPALDAVAGIGECLLVGALGDAEALMADGEAGIVHHREHAAHAVVRLAEQEADRHPRRRHRP